jgi:hypothetical protein
VGAGGRCAELWRSSKLLVKLFQNSRVLVQGFPKKPLAVLCDFNRLQGFQTQGAHFQIFSARGPPFGRTFRRHRAAFRQVAPRGVERVRPKTESVFVANAEGGFIGQHRYGLRVNTIPGISVFRKRKTRSGKRPLRRSDWPGHCWPFCPVGDTCSYDGVTGMAGVRSRRGNLGPRRHWRRSSDEIAPTSCRKRRRPQQSLGDAPAVVEHATAIDFDDVFEGRAQPGQGHRRRRKECL